MSASGQLPPVISSTGHLMPVEAMKAVIWTGFAFCLVLFCIRAYIRWIAFRRLMPEDWIMLAVLGIQLGAACVAQLRLHHVYTIEDVSNGVIAMSPTFLEEATLGLRGMFIQGLLNIIGIHAVKMSFLIFFHRMGKQITEHLVFWWVVVVISVGSFAVSMGLLETKCTLSPIEVIFFECTTKPSVDRQWRYMVVYCTIDAISDVFILCLPIAILWHVRLSLRKKIVLAAIFSLTLFTVAVTVIRGTIHTGRIASDGTQAQNIAWVWFWLSIEFISAYVIPCLVPFRILFVHNHRSQKSYRPQAVQASPKSPRKKFLDSLLDTLHEWEGTTRSGRGGFLLNDTLPSGRMSVDFMHYQISDNGSGNWPLVDGGVESAKPTADYLYAVTPVTRPGRVMSVERGKGFGGV